MRHFPIFLDLTSQSVIISGGGAAAVAKLRLLMRTAADITVYSDAPYDLIIHWAAKGKIKLVRHSLQPQDVKNQSRPVALFYAANENAFVDAQSAAIAKSAGILTNIVDNLNKSDFITPAIVDRAPLTVAIGTEGAAPVLARKIKRQLEDSLPVYLGILARIGQSFRSHATILPMGYQRRTFWKRYYSQRGEEALQRGGESAVKHLLTRLLNEIMIDKPEMKGVAFVVINSKDAELLTLKARNLLDNADIVIHDSTVASNILELARREAIIINTKYYFNKKNTTISDLIIKFAMKNQHIVRLVDDLNHAKIEINALKMAKIEVDFVPNVTIKSIERARRLQTINHKQVKISEHI